MLDRLQPFDSSPGPSQSHPGNQSITPGGVNYNPRSLRVRRGGASRRGAVVILEPQRELHYTGCDRLISPKTLHHLRVHSHLRFIRRELLPKLVSPRNHEKCVHNSLLNFSVHAKVDQITSVNAPA